MYLRPSVAIGTLISALALSPLAAQQPLSLPYVVVFEMDTPFTSFPPGRTDDRARENPTAWAYLDPAVLGTVQLLEIQYGVRSEYVYSAALKGFAAHLTTDQRDALQRLPFVASIEPDAAVWRSDGLALSEAAAVRNAHVYVLARRVPPWLDTLDRVDLGAVDPRCPSLPRKRGASVTVVQVGACSTGVLRTASILKGLDWIAATAERPAIVRHAAGSVPHPVLDAAIARVIELGLTNAPVGEPAASDVGAASQPIGPQVLLAPATPGAALYNLRIVSDASPDLTDLASLMHSTTSRWPSGREKVWALFYWSHILKRQTAPIVRHGFELTDPIRNFSDYGFTMCSTISGINQVLHEALGLRHQFWDICNHTVAQVEYDGAFHMIDSSMSHLVTTDDGVTLASLQQAAADSARLVRERSLYATSPNGFLTGSDTLRNLTDFVRPDNGGILNGFSDAFCENGLKFRDYYYNWDSGHRYVLNLRESESYTRYYRRLGSTAEYWVPSERISAPDPANTFEIDAANTFGIRGNGRWTFSPILTGDAAGRSVYRSTNVKALATGGLTPEVAAQPAELVYKVQAANAITSQRIDARFARTDARANASLSVSVNHGLTWTQVATLGATVGTAVPLSVLLRDRVSGEYETLIRIQMANGGSLAGIVLTGLTIETLTQVNTKALPKLHVGRNEVHVGAGNRSDTMVLWPDLRADFWRRDAYAAGNIASQGVSVPRKYTAVVYPAVLTQDAHLTYRMEAPTDITRLVYGGRLHNFSAGSYIDFLHSFDEGATWTRSYRLSDVTKPWDVIHYETVTNIPSGVRSVLFKFLMHNTSTAAWRATGLYAVRMEVNHRPPNESSRPLEVTFRWKEVGTDRTTVDRSHRQRIASFPFTYVVNVGGADHPTMESVKVNLEDPSDPTPYGYGGGADPGGSKYVHRQQIAGVNVAVNRPYTFSRAPSGFQLSAGAANTRVLTDGVVGPPVMRGTSYWWGQCWSSGANVDLRVDLGSSRTVAAFRAHIFGYPWWDALKGQVQDTIEVLTSTDGVTFTSRGRLRTSLWKKDVPINHMLQDDERATAWNFELTTAPVSTRYVIYRMTPRRILCASELQVLDRIAYQNFDIRIALPAAPTSDRQPPIVALTGPAQGAVVSGTVPLTATAGDNVAVSRVEFLVNGSVVGTDTTVPYAVNWPSGGVGDGIATVSARAFDAAGNTATSPAVNVTVANSPPGPGGDIVLYAARASVVGGAWRVEPSTSAAGGAMLRHPNAGMARPPAPLAAPANYFELTFDAEANVPYHLWLRGRADGNSWANDSAWVQFSNVATFAIGTTSAATVTLEDCTSCGVSGWGWQDNGWGPNVLGPHITFTTGGKQTIRIQTREDGFAIDQIILSPVRFLTAAPGALKNDATIYPPS